MKNKLLRNGKCGEKTVQLSKSVELYGITPLRLGSKNIMHKIMDSVMCMFYNIFCLHVRSSWGWDKR